MKKIGIVILLIFMLLCLTGCNDKVEDNIRKMELVGNLVTYKAYFHNVIEHDKPADVGITHLFEKDRKLFAEYTGTIRIGIDLSKVKIELSGKDINVFIPKAIIIGEPDVDSDDFKAENFIESKDNFINRNPITADDSIAAFEEAQEKMKEEAINNNDLLLIAQKRAKMIIEENIKQVIGKQGDNYKIVWEYEV